MTGSIRMSEDTKASAGKAETPAVADAKSKKKPKEVGGPAGPEPTRYGDWERGGRCVDF
jgi:hypothetical protein